VPLAVPSVRHSSLSKGLWIPTKYATPAALAMGVSSSTPSAAPGLMSLIITVPAAVPLLFQISCPVVVR
jgi:hypothetical protein